MHGAKALLQSEMFSEEGQHLAAADSSTNGFSIDATGYFLSPPQFISGFFPLQLSFKFATQLSK